MWISGRAAPRRDCARQLQPLRVLPRSGFATCKLCKLCKLASLHRLQLLKKWRNELKCSWHPWHPWHPSHPWPGKGIGRLVGPEVSTHWAPQHPCGLLLVLWHVNLPPYHKLPGTTPNASLNLGNNIWYISYNNSLTWIVRPFGDDFPYYPWFQWGRSEVGIIHPDIYIYI